jgi:hypothetical protein
MCKNRKFIIVLISSIILMLVLSLKLTLMKNRFTEYKKPTVFSKVIAKDDNNLERYGYSDILDCIKQNSNLQIQSINIIENQKCNVEVLYSGEIKLLYNSLYSLSKSGNFIGVNSININKYAKITSISLDFKKNK